MSHRKLRENKRCENCGQFVEKRFCPQCGQENVETRQSFHYLFTHFVGDFLHYDSRFWKTIKHLLFSPAKLTKEYLAGKRNLYVSPVTLYIFISFITFFVPAILPEKKTTEKEATSQETVDEAHEELSKEGLSTTSKKTLEFNFNNEKEVASQETVDEAHKELSKEGLSTPSKRTFEFSTDKEKKLIEISKDDKKYDWDDEKFKEKFIHDFPKAIFIYMPIFAFWLWLFHNKKKWYYFDHGIYTLHYFSFVLLNSLILISFQWLFSFFDLTKIGIIKLFYNLFVFFMLCYFIYYFFHSHRLLYQERKAKSRFKCSMLFIINTICILIFLILYMCVEALILDKTVFTEIISQIKSDS